MDDLDTRLSAYADGALDIEATADIEALLASDARARRIVQTHREVTSLLRAACAAEMYEGVRLAPPARRMAPRRTRAYAIAASVALLITGYAAGWSTAVRPAEASFIDDVAEYHAVYQHETKRLVELTAAQTDEINSWLGEKLDRQIVPPDLSADGLHFAGARMWISNGRPVADLFYTRDSGLPVAICIVQTEEKAKPGSGITTARSDGLQMAYWQSGRHIMAVVGELNEAEARRIAERSRQQEGG
jgi:anti-sigma factor RsiW